MRVTRSAGVFLFSAVFILLLYSLFSLIYINKTYDSLSNKEEGGLVHVNMNDVVKSAQQYLESPSKSALDEALKSAGFSLRLYMPDGLLLIDSSNAENAGRRYDLNQLLSNVAVGQELQIIPYKGSGGLLYAVAIIDTHQYTPDLEQQKSALQHGVVVIAALYLILLLLIAFLIYKYILHPFKKMESFATEVARGNLDLPLQMNKNNIFGAFTWAFDMLRTQLAASRQKEQESQKAKKELVAVLSHDIRTPVATIRAYAEYMKGLDRNSERFDRYINKIMEKADEITKLTNDLFLHAISDLEKLEVKISPEYSRQLLISIIEPLILQHSDNRIVITRQIPDVLVATDKQRLAQVIENLVTNSVKYSPASEIHFTAFLQEDQLICRIEDFGDGVLPEDIPFLFEKFFRGKNAKEGGQDGSGLGLYISKYLIEKMGGSIKVYNRKDNAVTGFVVDFSISRVK